MIEAKIHVGGVYRDIGVVLGHFLRAYAETGDSLFEPNNFSVILIKRRNLATQRPTNRAQRRDGHRNDIVKDAVSR